MELVFTKFNKNIWIQIWFKWKHSYEGDAFAAMVLAWLTKLNDLRSACEHTVSSMLHILKRTNESRTNNDELLEIKLIQSKLDIENPEIIVKSEIIPKK